MTAWRDLVATAGAGATRLQRLVLLAAGVLVAILTATRPGGAADAVEIFVASNNWHSEIVLPRALVDAAQMPELADLAPSPYVAFGWGDAAYYPARTPGVEAALRAAFKATPAVLHVTPVDRDPRRFYGNFEVLALTLTAADARALARYVDSYFDRGSAGTAQQAAPGLYRDSRFYAATGKFHALNTCNTWTARGLMKAGLRVGIKRPVYAEELMEQLRPLAEGTPQREQPGLSPLLPPSSP